MMGFRRPSLAIALMSAACGLGVVGVQPEGGDGGAAADGGSGADGSATGDGGPAADASSSGNEAGPIGDTGPLTITTAGSLPAPTGNAQQTHLIYAENERRWWLFTIDSAAPTALQTWTSTDFVTWSKAPDLALPRAHQGRGADFTVAYASIAAHDVVHLGMGLEGTGGIRSHYHARAVVQGAALAWSTLSSISTVDDSLLLGPAGNATIIGPTGRVTDFTGCALYGDLPAYTGNATGFRSQSTDDGTSWTPGFGSHLDIGLASKTINGRAAVSLGGESLMTLWESADDPEPDPATVRSSRSASGATGWTAPAPVFSEVRFGVNDWGVTALTTTDVHAIRRAGSFEHRRHNGTSWNSGHPIAAVPGGGKKNAGVVVLHDATRVAVATIAADSSIQITFWSGASWSDWRALTPGTSAGRSSLSGWWSPSAGLGLIWSESDGATTKVGALRIVP